MFERMTEPARRAVDASLREALQLGHNYIGTEHLLLALLRESDCAAAQILTQLGVERADILRVLADMLHEASHLSITDYRTDAT